MPATYRHIAHGFDPVFDGCSRILILGSFPSVLSRANEFYYGNPQNRFWRVLASYLGIDAPQTIDEKRRMLLEHGIALWDVIAECDIKGSSDASIKNVRANDVAGLLADSDVRAVICNGACAGRLYHKYLEYACGLEARVLPSTSPANAAWNVERLTNAWSEALDAARNAPAAPALPRRAAPAATDFGTHRSMQGNKGRDTKPELLVRRRLREAGLIGYRLQWPVAGRPDIAWPGKKVALFINGCFWHRCPRCNPSTPKKNTEYWDAKFARNQERDRQNVAVLEKDGWTVHVIWECQLKRTAVDETFADLLPQLAAELGRSI